MSHRERTIQQLDPLGALLARPFALFGALAMVAYALLMSWLNREDIDSQPLAWLAILGVASSASILAVGSSPARAPLRQRTFVFALAAAFLAAVLSAASMWQSNAFVQDDWGPVVIGIMLLASGPYRKSREIALAGSLAAIFVGFMVLLQQYSFAAPVPPVVFVIVAATPIVCMSIGASALTTAVIRSIRRWRSRATIAAQAQVSQLSDGIARSVQQDRVTILNRDVVPFFTDVLSRGEITVADRERARAISDTIRSVMVAEVDRSWLDGVVEQAGATSLGKDAPGAEVVQDDERLATQMTTDQRTAMRAFVVALFTHPAFDPDGFDIRITRARHDIVATMRASFTDGEATVRADLAPFLAVTRVVFVDLDAYFDHGTLTLRFFYDEN